MLTFYGSEAKGPISVDQSSGHLPPQVAWIDAFNPEKEEIEFLQSVMEVRVPSYADLIEIESSSRLSTDGDAILLSFAATVNDAGDFPKTTPIGFVITPQRVATLRFVRLPSFESLAAQLSAKGQLGLGGMAATLTIIEIIIDHLADLLERIGNDLDTVSRRIFTNGPAEKRRRPQKVNKALAELLATIGRNGNLTSKVSEGLLGLSRMGPYLAAKGSAQMTPELRLRLETISADLRSLHEFQDHLSNKTAFLLDTLLGLANIEQMNVFRFLTVASVIALPPTFISSLYGMNFKAMPELDWHYGYAYGLTLIALSALIPALMFKVKGWW